MNTRITSISDCNIAKFLAEIKGRVLALDARGRLRYIYVR